jgi:hypothetical protein
MEQNRDKLDEVLDCFFEILAEHQAKQKKPKSKPAAQAQTKKKLKKTKPDRKKIITSDTSASTDTSTGSIEPTQFKQNLMRQNENPQNNEANEFENESEVDPFEKHFQGIVKRITNWSHYLSQELSASEF